MLMKYKTTKHEMNNQKKKQTKKKTKQTNNM